MKKRGEKDEIKPQQRKYQNTYCEVEVSLYSTFSFL
jgi:hypothetical protein